MMRRYLMLAQYTYVALEAMFYPLNALVPAHYKWVLMSHIVYVIALGNTM